MIATCDVAIVGLGAVGSAAAWQLARRGVRVAGFDRHTPPHALGSSHGHTRITRIAVGEGDEYVPLVRRSHAIWRELEAAGGDSLYRATGGVVIGPAQGGAAMHGQADFVGHTIAVARRQGVEHEVVSADELMRRHPAFRLRGDERCYAEPESGWLRPEACIAAQLDAARAAGAALHVDEPVLALRALPSGVELRTARRTLHAGRAIVCAGPWLPGLLGEPFASRLRLLRQTLFWFDPDDAALYAPGRFPVFIWNHGPHEADMAYGFPLAPGPAGVKVGAEQYEATCDPDAARREPDAAEAAALHTRHVAGRLRGLSSRMTGAAACLYTVAAGARFVVERPEALPQAIAVSACSGHGFKHSAALGEALAETLLEGRSAIDLRPFGLDARMP